MSIWIKYLFVNTNLTFETGREHISELKTAKTLFFGNYIFAEGIFFHLGIDRQDFCLWKYNSLYYKRALFDLKWALGKLIALRIDVWLCERIYTKTFDILDLKQIPILCSI